MIRYVLHGSNYSFVPMVGRPPADGFMSGAAATRGVAPSKSTSKGETV